MKRTLFSKISAVVLSCILIVSLLPTVVFAEDTAVVSSVSELNSALKNEQVKEIHIGGSFTYKSGLSTDKTVVIDDGSVFTWNYDKGEFRTEKLVVNGSFIIKIEESFVNRLHVYGTVENNGNIEVQSETGNCYWHAPTTGDGTFIGTARTYVDYGTFAKDKIPTNAKVNLMKDVTQTWSVIVALNQEELVPGNTVTPTVSNLIDGVNVTEVFDITWDNPPNTTSLSHEPYYKIPLNMSGKKLQVSVTCKPGYALVTSSGTRGTIDSEVYVVNASDNSTLYVDSKNGSNTNTGTEKSPLETLTYALDNIADNGTIILLGDYDSKNDSMSKYYFYNNVTIKGGGAEKSTIIANKQMNIKDGVTVTFDNIDFGTKFFWITKLNSSSSGTGNLVFNNVSAGNLSVDGKNSVTAVNSTISGRFYPSNTLTLNNSTLNGDLSCDNFVAVGDVTLELNNSIEINKSVSVEKTVVLSPPSLDSGEIAAEVPDSDIKWASYFTLKDTENGKYALKCRSIDGTAYLIVSEKAAASGPLYLGFVPKEGAAVGENGNAVVSDKFCASVSSAVWSGYSDTEGKKWQAGDVPELTIVLAAAMGAKGDDCFYFGDDFAPEDFTFYDWQDTSQSADNFFKDEYKLSDAKTVVKSGQGVSDDGKSFTFTLQFPEVAHKLTKTDYKAPSCTEAGNIEYWHCENCDKYFSDEAGTKPITKEDTVLNALNHPSTVLKNAKAATCTEDGYTGDKYCTECGALVEAGKVIPAISHNYENGVCTMCGAKDPNFKPTQDNEETTTGGNGGTADDGNSVNNNSTTTTGKNDTSKNDNAQKDNNATSPLTGNFENVILLFAVLLIAGGILTAGTVYGRKKRSDK